LGRYDVIEARRIQFAARPIVDGTLHHAAYLVELSYGGQ
jgi:hypothetical protein